MADRLTEKKESESDDYRIPVVTPDRNRNAEEEGKQHVKSQECYPHSINNNTSLTSKIYTLV